MLLPEPPLALEQASTYYNKMIHGVPDVECLLFQDHSQQNTDNTKKKYTKLINSLKTVI